jgi:hypothetical protein
MTKQYQALEADAPYESRALLKAFDVFISGLTRKQRAHLIAIGTGNWTSGSWHMDE